MLPISARKIVALCCLLQLGVGCDTESASDVPTAWLGKQAHFELHGRINGKDIALSLNEDDLLEDGSGFYARRTWGVPDSTDLSTYSQGVFLEAEIRVEHPIIAEWLPELRMLEIEILGEKELIDAPPGTEIAIVPRSPEKILEVFSSPNTTFLEFELKDANDFKFYQEAALEGTFTIYENSGTLSDDGLTYVSDTGWVGGFFHARWSPTEELTGSFMVPGGNSKIESGGGYL